MLYYYANTGHKLGLERLRRGVALLNSLSSKGEETQLLVNDFRAGLVARDLGATSYVTIETVQDIDAIAEAGNSIIIDSVEDDHGRLVKYCADFKQVWRFAHDEKDSAVHNEIVIDMNTILVDDRYFEEKPKEDRVLFFLGDADYDKIILNNAEFFKQFDMELLLGNYFFVKYEDDLAKLFSTLHEPEEYEDLITTSSIVVTASSQTALEARASGAKVIYLNINKDTIVEESCLETYGISIVHDFDFDSLTGAIQDNTVQTYKNIEKIKDKNFLS
jgi:spore coat polysaccharide biosynthesis predicted glycosyltransferase SpsG